MPEKPSFLEYGATPSLGRRYGRRIVVCLAILVAVIVCAVWLPEPWQKFRRERWERAEHAGLLESILTDTPSPGAVAFEEDNSKATALSRSPDYALFKHPLTDANGARRRLLALAKLDPRLDTIDGIPSTRQHSILFCHERRAPGGEARLVVVEGVVNWEASSPGQTHVLPTATSFAIDAAAVAPLRVTSESDGPVIDAQMALDPSWAVRVFAGQADPRDAAHFWIEYQTSDGGKGTIDGWLRKSAGGKDEVELKLR